MYSNRNPKFSIHPTGPGTGSWPESAHPVHRRLSLQIPPWHASRQWQHPGLPVPDLVKDTIHEHKRIIFNGNGYDDAWIEEAESRGLLNLKTTPDALPYSILERCLVGSQAVIVACRGHRQPEQILVLIHGFDDCSQEQKELCIFIWGVSPATSSNSACRVPTSRFPVPTSC